MKDDMWPWEGRAQPYGEEKLDALGPDPPEIENNTSPEENTPAKG